GMPTRLNFLPQRYLKWMTRNEVGRFSNEADCHVIAGGYDALRKRTDAAGRQRSTNQREVDYKPERPTRPGALAHSPCLQSRSSTKNHKRVLHQLFAASASSAPITALTGGRTLTDSSYSFARMAPFLSRIKMIGLGTP